MNLPILNADDVENIFYNCKVIGAPLKGGQKVVFPCEIEGSKCAIKFILLSEENEVIDENKQSVIDIIQARANREISIMESIDSPNIVKLSNPELIRKSYKGQEFLVYAEEWIEGKSVDQLIAHGPMPISESLKLCIDITSAIQALWNIAVVHRDIKPQNIIRRESSGEYVLLDMGLAFDLEDKSLTQYGAIPGTKIYFSPEQLDYTHKRDIDFRSDLFSLGVVMYQVLTIQHPFYQTGMTDHDLFTNILLNPIVNPKILNNKIPDRVASIICRLLSKQPNARYRKCDMLLNEIATLNLLREELE